MRVPWPCHRQLLPSLFSIFRTAFLTTVVITPSGPSALQWSLGPCRIKCLSSSDPSRFKARLFLPFRLAGATDLKIKRYSCFYSSAVSRFQQSGSPTPTLQARPILMQERYSDLVDPRLKAAGYDPDEMNRFIKAAMLSIRSTATKRPKMTQVRDVSG